MCQIGAISAPRPARSFRHQTIIWRSSLNVAQSVLHSNGVDRIKKGTIFPKNLGFLLVLLLSKVLSRGIFIKSLLLLALFSCLWYCVRAHLHCYTNCFTYLSCTCLRCHWEGRWAKSQEEHKYHSTCICAQTDFAEVVMIRVGYKVWALAY